MISLKEHDWTCFSYSASCQIHAYEKDKVKPIVEFVDQLHTRTSNSMESSFYLWKLPDIVFESPNGNFKKSFEDCYETVAAWRRH